MNIIPLCQSPGVFASAVLKPASSFSNGLSSIDAFSLSLGIMGIFLVLLIVVYVQIMKAHDKMELDYTEENEIMNSIIDDLESK